MISHRLRFFRLVGLTCVVACAVCVLGGGSSTSVAGASTDPGTIIGEGGTFLQPVIDKLLNDDATALAPLNPSYTNVDVDGGIADFIGTQSGQYNADFAVSERPLTASEAQKAATDGRTFAYVPFAATPVAIATVVPISTYDADGYIDSTDLCPHIPLTVDELGEIFGYDANQPLETWDDSRIDNCSNGDALKGYSVANWANLDPTMENYALMALLDSDTTPNTGSKALFDAALQKDSSSGGLVCTDATVQDCDTPAENWPIDPQNQIPGGDETFLAKVIGISQTTNAPTTNAAEWQLGATFPISSVWTGSPLGVYWGVPTAAVQNAQGAFVAPSEAAAAAAEKDATLASTSDPTTNNLVTFNASSTDPAAYNNYLMVEDYLVVPTNGLPADKASALAQLIRFVLGTKGQSDISGYGAAPVTPTMVTAGLKVAAQLDAEAISTTTSSSTTTPSTPGSTTTTTSASAAVAGDSSSTGSDGAVTSSSSEGGGSLAVTGADIWPLVMVGTVLTLSAETLRRRCRPKKVVR